MKQFKAVCVLLICLAADIASVSAAGGDLKKAKQYFEEGLYNEALKEYNDALTEQPDSGIINFGAGCTNYKKDSYQEAVNNFNKGLLTEDKSLEAKAYYNLGNSKYRLAESQENNNIEEAVSLYGEAAEYYKKAIKNNPKDSDARYNYEFAVRKLNAAADKAKQQPQQKQESQEKQQQEKASKENIERKDAEEETMPEPEEGKEAEEMSKEEAMMLIDSFSAQELEEKKKEETITYSQEYQDW